MNEFKMAYSDIMSKVKEYTHERKIDHLFNVLPEVWVSEYRKFKNSYGQVVELSLGKFTFLFDCGSPLNIPEDDERFCKGRVVVAFGRSAPKKGRKDDSRLQGWVGPTEKYFGKEWDKGHFIADSIGGEVRGKEFNVFIQNRALNRGWSAEGKLFRKMEKYCNENSGVFCFHRPIYTDATLKPTYLEFGVLTLDDGLWTELFKNFET